MNKRKDKEILEVVHDRVGCYDMLDMYSLIGIIGSSDFNHIGHDLDMLFLPKPGVKPGEFLQAHHLLLEKITSGIRETGYAPVISQRFAHQDERFHIAREYNPAVNLLSIHNLSFFDTESMKKLTPERFQDEALRSINIICGSGDAASDLNNSYTEAHLVLMVNYPFCSEYPDDFVRRKTERVIGYIEKFYLGGSILPKSSKVLKPKECAELWFNTAKYLDKMVA